MDEVIELYKRDVDRTLLIENLKLTPDERFAKFALVMEGVIALHEAGVEMRRARREAAADARAAAGGAA